MHNFSLSCIRYCLVAITVTLISGCGGGSSNNNSQTVSSKGLSAVSNSIARSLSNSKTSVSLSSAGVNTSSQGGETGSLQPSAQEVLVVELINRARFDPNAEATRFGIGLNDGITNGTISSTQKKPLAHNLYLLDASRKHSQWILDVDIFDHVGVNNSSPGKRMEAAGYVFSGAWANGENISWEGTTRGAIDLTSTAFSHHEGLFKSPGHRLNILSEGFREIGVGQRQGFFTDKGKEYLSSMLTEGFARSGSSYYLTGVIYDDFNSSNFYDVGEGLSDVSISVNGQNYSAYSTGAYSIALVNGSYDVVFSSNNLPAQVTYKIKIEGGNLKLDVIKVANTTKVNTW
jgi:uncharacterized protein YkwD